MIRTDDDLDLQDRYKLILQNHYKNKKTYYIKNKLKPITIFINHTVPKAVKNREQFIEFLAENLPQIDNRYKQNSKAELYSIAREKTVVIVSDSKITNKQDLEKFNNIEETNEDNIGGKVEFIFSVNKLTEG